MKKLITLFAIAGMVLALAPAAQAAPGDIISGETATASSDWEAHLSYGRPIEALVNNSGMTGEGATGVHQTSDYTTGWMTGHSSPAPWIKVDLGGTYDVGNMYVWNGLPGLPSWGAQTVDIYYATTDPGVNVNDSEAAFNPAGWDLWNSGVTFAQYVSGSYTPTDTIALNVNARYIALIVTAQYDGPNNTSIAELQFEEGSPAEPTVQLDGGTTGNVDENQPIGTFVGGLSTLLTGDWGVTNLDFAGGTDDASFSISGTNLLTAEIFDEDVKSSYSIDVSADDGPGGNATTNTFTITIDSVTEPVDRMFANAEVKSTTTLAATLEAMAGGVTYGITADEHHAALFDILNTDELHLKTAATAGQVGDEYFVEVTASGGVTDSMLIKVTVVSGTPKGTVFIFR